MSLKKEVRACDFCETELSGEFLSIRDVPHEGASHATLGKLYYEFGDSDFCSLECFIKDLNKTFPNKNRNKLCKRCPHKKECTEEEIPGSNHCFAVLQGIDPLEAEDCV